MLRNRPKNILIGVQLRGNGVQTAIRAARRLSALPREAVANKCPREVVRVTVVRGVTGGG